MNIAASVFLVVVLVMVLLDNIVVIFTMGRTFGEVRKNGWAWTFILTFMVNIALSFGAVIYLVSAA